MNTNHLKKFAQDARRKLLEQVGAKLSFVLTTDSAELREKTEQLKQLRQELSRTSKEQLIEKVAYTWFNRLMALRFMDVNDYQPLGIRIITPKDGYTIPELLDEAKRGNIPEDLKVNQQKIYDLLDNKIPSNNQQNEVFKGLLIATCNHLHTTFPFLFERINDYTELLLPDDLTSDFSILKNVRDGMLFEDCKDVEIIGWIYQYYISEKKAEVFESKLKVKREDIPAATQLFTPRWIVEYMVQNTVGKLWLQNRPKSKIRDYMPYFIESVSLISDDFIKVGSPEEIKLADPACGSGHILVYAFDLLSIIYEEEGYNTIEIPKLIIEKNLFGFEIDERAAQLSAMALMMKARKYQQRALHQDIKSNILCYSDLFLSIADIKETLNTLNIKVSDNLIYDFIQMQQATNFGSLIKPHAKSQEIERVQESLIKVKYNTNIFLKNRIDGLILALTQLLAISQKFHCIVANPPYMGSGNMNKELSEWIKINYPLAKSDLYSCFIEKTLETIPDNGLCGMVTMESWMFIGSFEDFRKVLLENSFISSLIHMPYLGKGGTSMGINFGTCSFVLKITKNSKNEKGHFQCIRYYETNNQGVPLRFPTMNEKFKNIHQDEFKKIPSSIIGYFLPKSIIQKFQESLLRDYCIPRIGLVTGDSPRFLRLWYEVSINKTNINGQGLKWFKYQKGGDYRKWYGNNQYVLNWENDGNECKNNNSTNDGRIKSHNYNGEFAFRRGIVWTKITTGLPSFRKVDEGFMFDDAGPLCWVENENHIYGILAFLNSKTCRFILETLSPTLNLLPGHLNALPIAFKPFDLANFSENLTNDHIEDWNTKEISWDFKHNELLRIRGIDFEETYELFKQYWGKKLFQNHKKEEELNLQLIEIYELHNELTPEVPLENITILQDELDRKALSKINKKLERDSRMLVLQNLNKFELPFIPSEIIDQFISYSVGCMFGRYSLDEAGLVLANQGEILQDFHKKISKSEQECSFLPDADNIIPILDDEWFDDDIVGKFHKFLKSSFGEKYFNKNLLFIEEQIGKDIRKYFIKDFYPNHIKRYKKRPIYWMFSSAKGSFNVLIYIHRYTPDTVSNILNKYLKEYIGKLKTRREHLQQMQVSGSPAEKTKAIKETDSIDKMLVELQEYERDILYPLATERIAIDLDDGVLINYNKFGKAVKEVNGLNDSATKKKVNQFDWIDATQIR